MGDVPQLNDRREIENMPYKPEERLELKEDSQNYPLTIFWHSVRKVFIILVETFNPLYSATEKPDVYNKLINFVISIAEPEQRPQYIHQYSMTAATLKAATQVGYTVESLERMLNKYNKFKTLPRELCTILNSFKTQSSMISISLFDVDNYIIRFPINFNFRLQISKGTQAPQTLDQKYNFKQCDEPDEYYAQVQNTRYIRKLLEIGQICEFRKDIRESGQYQLVEEYYMPGQPASLVGAQPKQSKTKFKIPIVRSYRGVPDDFYKNINDEQERKTVNKDILMAFDEAQKYQKEAPPLNADLKSTTQLRQYQQFAVDKVVSQMTVKKFNTETEIKKLNSGMVILPCGSGKSLQGIATACKIKKACLVITNTNMSNTQWKNQFLSFSTIDESRIFVFQSNNSQQVDDVQTSGHQKQSGYSPLFVPGYHTVFIATYVMLTKQANNSKDYAKVIRQLVKSQVWGVCLFDEAH